MLFNFKKNFFSFWTFVEFWNLEKSQKNNVHIFFEKYSIKVSIQRKYFALKFIKIKRHSKLMENEHIDTFSICLFYQKLKK